MIKPSPYEMARASYGKEPYRTPAEISTSERALAVMEGATKDLLRGILGLSALQQFTELLYPKKFRDLLPTTEEDLKNYVLTSGLPRRMASYTQPQSGDNDSGMFVFQVDVDTWCVASVDEYLRRNDEFFSSKQEAELRVLTHWLHVFSRFLVVEDSKV